MASDLGADEDHPDFNNNSRWPRRLLHVPTMTSYKWSPGNKYGNTTEPVYVAMSYTWGRFMLKDGEMPHLKPLLIRGINWPVPRVNPETHFSVPELQHIIKRAVGEPRLWYAYTNHRHRQNTWKRRAINSFLRLVERHVQVYQYLWLDIACIDQRWTRTTMLEVGRQARIFSHATHAYVWLCRLEEPILRPLLNDLRGASYGLQREPFVKDQAQRYQSRPWLRMAIACLTELMSDPWFSSLWTLQEAFLCAKAVILSRDGQGILEASQLELQSWTLQRLFVFTNDIILWSQRSRAPRAEPEFGELMTLVHKSGLGALWLNTPMGLLGVSQNRTTTRALDRVYGVMQVFGSDFRVGDAREDVDPDKEYTLDELEDEFGASIIEQYPVLSQMHVHLVPPMPGKGWCVRGSSAVPLMAERGDLFGWASGDRLDATANFESNCTPLGEITTSTIQGNLWAKLAGRACRFARLQQAWRQADDSPFASKMLQSNWRMHRSTIPSIHMIALDRGTDFEPDIPELQVLDVCGTGTEEHQHELAIWLTGRPGADGLHVFLLSRCQMNQEFFHTGLLLVERTAASVKHWQRIGICMWLTSHLSGATPDTPEYPGRAFLSGETEEWTPFEGVFG